MSPRFGVNWPFEEKLGVSRWPMVAIWFLIRTILAIFDLQVTLKLPTKFRVKILGLGEEAKNRFSR